MEVGIFGSSLRRSSVIVCCSPESMTSAGLHSFSGSLSGIKVEKIQPHRSSRHFSRPSLVVVAEGRTKEAEKYSGNGRATRMMSPVVNGSPVVINGTSSIVKKIGNESSLGLNRSSSSSSSTQKKQLPFVEDLKVLPSDEGFSWAKDDYNSVQRSIDIWSCVLSLRLRILFDNGKWSYIDGFTEEKQVFGCQFWVFFCNQF